MPKMSKLSASLTVLIFGTLLACNLPALGQGDLAPRGSLLYARINDLGEALQKLQGDNWKDAWERLLLTRNERDFNQSEPLISEIRRFVDYLGETEVAIADIMLRDPNVQMVLSVKLKEGAPKEFTEELREWVKREDRKAEVTATSFRFETFRFELRAGLLLLTVGGMLDAHLADVLEGFTDESLSQTERFQKWNERAKGDIVVYADMKAWRNAIDRLGEKPDADTLLFNEVIEWQKWDMINASVTLPGETSGGVSVNMDLTFAQPLTRANAFLKPSGASRLVGKMPAEMLGFIQGQLGNNHEQTYMDLLSTVHDISQGGQKASIERRLRWLRQDLEYSLERLKMMDEAEKDKDKDDIANPQPQDPKPRRVEPGSGEDEYDPRKELEAEIARLKEQIADAEAELAGHRTRPFTTDFESLGEGERLSDAERFYVELDETLGRLGLTRVEAFSALGAEVIAGIIGLHDPRPDDDDPSIFEDMWFVVVETTDQYPDVKKKLLDRLLARALPEDMPEEEREEIRESAKRTLFKEVEGGEILRFKRGGTETMFSGDGFMGIAANDEVARMILKSGIGNAARFGSGNVPGGQVAGSKFAYGNMGEMIARMLDGSMERARQSGYFPAFYVDMRKYFPGGWHLAISTNESSHVVSLSAQTGGERNAARLITLPAKFMEEDARYDHDRGALTELGDAFSAWLRQNQESLAKMKPDERNQAIRAVTIESLKLAGHYTPTDGLRSAFDPAQQDAFAAMLKARSGSLAPADKAADLSQAGFEWYGVPPEKLRIETGGEGEYDEYEKRIDYGSRSGQQFVVVAAMKGDWACGGRMVLLLRGNRLDYGWLHADDLRKVREANAAGKPVNLEPDEKSLPAWRARRMLQRQSWSVETVQELLKSRKMNLANEGKEFKITFDGKQHADPLAELRKLLGLTEEDWLSVDNIKNLKIETTPEGFKLTLAVGDEWLEMKPNGEMVFSWDN